MSPSVLFGRQLPACGDSRPFLTLSSRPTGTLTCIRPQALFPSILGGRADRTIAGDKAEDLCIVGPDAPASHSQLLTGRLKQPGIAHSTFPPAWSFQSPEPGSAPQTGRPFPIGRAALFSADHRQRTPGTKNRSEAEPVMTFTSPSSHADPAFLRKTSLT